ncbi:MCE family protein [Mycolicibacterium diernhoferi]|uniref:Mammalian cell entry protein n=1 Tax=Mycolicibacterium diernhoferi TaxID=1801 RepID=A0A1Q4HFW3_9MYCO|nr:MCE family protein [Mycolicibacterium diernhoferi]OJZ66418.1 mammalian cell entry protein [Mycolicibacterium diernhoferi]OPE56380.1 mammalian cell entry protein [Mycolicibacterium diernhoferi]PEG54218.1 mammalian cell entry protein [Mycolicibacterium diernhoferi]QYL24591.1 MCE family protein [Mycolicibacterium diernhoferi]
MNKQSTPWLKFGIFATATLLLTAALFTVFGEYRGGSTVSYSAVFIDASGLEPGDSVRAGGLRVGTVTELALQADDTVVVAFDTDRHVVLSSDSRAAVRYLNLVGDRYLEVIDVPGAIAAMPPGARIPVERTTPALDLDQLLGGLRPVIRGLNPADVNALTASLVQVFQGQGGTLESLLSSGATLTSDLADRNHTVELLIDNLNEVMASLASDGEAFGNAIDRFQTLVSGLAEDRDPIGAAIDSLSMGTTAIGDLLSGVRPPLAESVHQLSRLAPLLDHDKEQLDIALGRAPGNFRKLVRLGAYGSWLNYYICELSFRVSDLEGRTVVIPWTKQEGGRCSEP